MVDCYGPTVTCDSEFSTHISIHDGRQPLTALTLNHDDRTMLRRRNFTIQSNRIDPRILDDDPDYDEDAEPDSTPALTRGLFTSNIYIFKQVANTLVLNCDSRTIYPLKSANIPHAWIPYLKAVPSRPDGIRVLRDYYPLPYQQKQFDEWEATHPPEVFPGMHTYNLCTIPSYWDDEIPPVPLGYLIIGAISGSPSNVLTEREIKLALIRRFPYFAQRLARNSRWQISLNWILNRHACFQPVPRETVTPEDDGCAYRTWSLPTFQTLIFPEEDDPQEVPIHVFLPIDYGESVSDLSLKPTRPARRSRRLVSSKASSPTMLKHDYLTDSKPTQDSEVSFTPLNSQPKANMSSMNSSDSNPSRSSSPTSLDIETDFSASDEECLIWSPAPSLSTLCTDEGEGDIVDYTHGITSGSGLLNVNPGWDSEYVVPSRMPLASYPYPSRPVLRLKNVGPEDDQPPWDLNAPSLRVQAALMQSVKLGSDEKAKAKLREKMLKAQRIFFENQN